MYSGDCLIVSRLRLKKTFDSSQLTRSIYCGDGDDIPRGSTDADENRKHVLYYYQLVKDAGEDVPIIEISHWPGLE